jgi:hypothetical protein
MLNDRKDDFYGARLIADARLHLGSVINGSKSEVFFVTMCKIVKNQFYLGYKTFGGRDVKMSGVKDFLFNSNYGLGIKKITLSTFLANCAKAGVEDKTQLQCAARFAKWLGEQNEGFDFPQEYFEFLRIKHYIEIRYKRKKREMFRRLAVLKRLYDQYPHLLERIGAEKKYGDVIDCAVDVGFLEKPLQVGSASLYKNTSDEQMKKIARKISDRFGKYKTRVLIASLIEVYKLKKEQERDSKSDNDT